ncbi:MAG: hypothetical protein P8X58_08425 [Syntrophobacterales bacterium]
MAKSRLAWSVLIAFLAVSFLACASRSKLRPRVQPDPRRFPNSLVLDGLALAVVPFDGQRDVYWDPADPKPLKPDFKWLQAEVRPTRIIMANDSLNAVVLDPSQVTAIDLQGVAYQAYSPQEAGDAVVESEAFRAYLRGGLKGALVGGAIGAGLGAAVGAATGGRDYYGYWGYGRYRGPGVGESAAWGGALGGVGGLIVGVAKSRDDLERRVRRIIDSRQLPKTVIRPGMTGDGLVFFPVVPLKAVRLVLTDPDRQATRTVEIQVSTPPTPVQVTRTEQEKSRP